jgi:hypothetical protein
MLIKGVPIFEMKRIADELGFRLDNVRERGRYYGLVLRMAVPTNKRKPETLRYRKLRWRGDGWTGAVCYHGHWEFMERVFAINPNAVIRTKMSTYKGLEGFKANAPGVAHANVGSMMTPSTYGSLCEC